MALHREFGDADKDPGVWHDWKEDPEQTARKGTKVMVRACIRGIPQSVENKIKGANRAESMTIRQPHRSNYSETDLDMERQRKIARDRAAFALVETESYEVFVGDDDAAKTYSRLLGEIVPKAVNVTLDGKWGHIKSETRGHVLTEHADFTIWICGVVDGDAAATNEKRAELASNS